MVMSSALRKRVFADGDGERRRRGSTRGPLRRDHSTYLRIMK
jgi:hypothetical protein